MMAIYNPHDFNYDLNFTNFGPEPTLFESVKITDSHSSYTLFSHKHSSISNLAKDLIDFKKEEAVLPKLEIKENLKSDHQFKSIQFPFSQDTNHSWLLELDRALQTSSISIESVEEGISTTYLLCDKEGKKLALFKPDSGTAKETDNDQASVREHLAWVVGRELIDTPPVFVAELNLEGEQIRGSLQPFVESNGTFEKYLELFLKTLSPSFCEETAFRMASKELTDEDPTATRGMAILDLLIQNTDRMNPANTLIKATKQGNRIVAIDHNLAFSPAVVSAPYELNFWYHSEAIRQPFSDKEVRWISRLDSKEITAKMEEAGLDSKRIRAFKVMATLLQTGAKGGLTLFDILQLHKGTRHYAYVLPSIFQIAVDKIQAKELDVAAENVELRRDIHSMVMEIKDESEQFGCTKEARIHDYVYKNLYKSDDYLDIYNEALDLVDEAQPLRSYEDAGSCPKEYVDLRFNETDPENFLV